MTSLSDMVFSPVGSTFRQPQANGNDLLREFHHGANSPAHPHLRTHTSPRPVFEPDNAQSLINPKFGCRWPEEFQSVRIETFTLAAGAEPTLSAAVQKGFFACGVRHAFGY